MPTHARPETIVATLIDSATSHTIGSSLFSGPPKPALADNGVAVNCVFCYGFQSFQPENRLGSGTKTRRDFRVTILVRYGPDQFRAGQDMCRDIWQALQQQNISANTGFTVILMDESDATYLGQDDTDNHRWEMHARLIYVGS